MTWGVDDYPGSLVEQANGADQYGNGWKQCTSWGEHRIVDDIGHAAMFLGNGGSWGQYAAAAGIPVDGSPQVHDMFSLPPGVNGSDPVDGHCGGVLQVDVSTGQFLAEDYNWVAPLAYGQHWLPIANTQFIHFGGGPAPTPPPTAENQGMGFALLGNGSQALFVHGPADHIYHWYETGGQWYGPLDVSQMIATVPVIAGEPAAAPGGGGDDVTLTYRLQQDGKLYIAWRSGGTWNGPLQLPGQ